MKCAGKARNNGLYRHIRTSKEIIRNLLNDYFRHITIIKEDASADFVSVGAFSFAKFGDTQIKKPPQKVCPDKKPCILKC